MPTSVLSLPIWLLTTVISVLFVGLAAPGLLARRWLLPQLNIGQGDAESGGSMVQPIATSCSGGLFGLHDHHRRPGLAGAVSRRGSRGWHGTDHRHPVILVGLLATIIGMVVILITAYGGPFVGDLAVSSDSYRLVLDAAKAVVQTE